MTFEENDRLFRAVVNHITIGAGGQGFDFRAGQIGHIVANGSPPLRHFLGEVLLRCYAPETNSATRYTFRRNIAGIVKVWF